MVNRFTEVKVFSASKAREREELGTVITQYLRGPGRNFEVVDKEVRLSSDAEFHCLTIVLFLRERGR